MQTRREFLHQASILSGLVLYGWAALRPSRGSVALQSGVEFLLRQQLEDGAWRSAQYAAFREGDALTPLVLRVLAEVRLPAVEPAIEKGMRWLEQLTDSLRNEAEPWPKLRYPLFTASDAARFFARAGDAERARFWSGVVGRLRIERSLGWTAFPSACGAWSDASLPPCLPAGTEFVPDMLAPNISATLLGIEGLAAGNPLADLAAALPFLSVSQNLADEASSLSNSDGGFFFAINDPIRNKAGVATIDPVGKRRFRSYGSATCDGLLALRRCGSLIGDPRVNAALAWLQRQANGAQHAGQWPVSRAGARESLVFYYSQAFAEVLAWAGTSSEHSSWAHDQARQLIRDLEQRQNADGSWTGAYADSCEDDPVLATAFAVRALALGSI